MLKDGQIRIIQAGAELFGFDTIKWPGDVFYYPIVYEACAMNEDSYDAGKPWKWIKREQFEWLVKHVACMVSYVGANINDGHTFYCMHHMCWEFEGKDFYINGHVPIEEYYVEPDMDEERKI